MHPGNYKNDKDDTKRLDHLQTVDGQPTSGLRSTILQLRDNGVVHILLLLTKELCANRVEGITT